MRLWHDRHDLNQGGLYSYPNVRPEIDGGKMDGFIKEQEKIFHKLGHDDVAGYHTGADIPQLRPDPRPDVRENARHLGRLAEDFDFSHGPRKPVLLPVHPKTDLIEPR